MLASREGELAHYCRSKLTIQGPQAQAQSHEAVHHKSATQVSFPASVAQLTISPDHSTLSATSAGNRPKQAWTVTQHQRTAHGQEVRLDYSFSKATFALFIASTYAPFQHNMFVSHRLLPVTSRRQDVGPCHLSFIAQMSVHVQLSRFPLARSAQ